MAVEIDKLIGELVRAPEELLLEDRAAALVHRAARALKAVSASDQDTGYLTTDLQQATDIVREAFGKSGHDCDVVFARRLATRILSLSFMTETLPASGEDHREKIARLEAALRPFANSDARHLPAYWCERPQTAVAGVCDFSYADLIAAHLALYGEDRPLPTDGEGRSIQPGLAKYGFGPRRPSPSPAVVKPLEWAAVGEGYVADAPLFGRIRVESHGSGKFAVEYSVPGFSDTFVAGDFLSAEVAREAAQIEYERRIHAALVPDVIPVHKRVAFETLALGARFRYREHDDTVWVKIASGLVAKWDEKLVADTWVGQSVCSFDEDDDFATVVYLVPEQGDVASVPHAPNSAVISDLLSKAEKGPWAVHSQNGDPEESFRGVCARPQVNSRGHEVRSYVAQYCLPHHAELFAIAPQLAAEVIARRSSVGIQERASAIEEAAKVIDRHILEYERDYEARDKGDVLKSANLFAVTALSSGARKIRELAESPNVGTRWEKQAEIDDLLRHLGEPRAARSVILMVSEHEIRLLGEVRRENDSPSGFRSWVPSGGGTKGSNFRRINLEKRAEALVAKGLLARTPHGYEITPEGRRHEPMRTELTGKRENENDIT